MMAFLTVVTRCYKRPEMLKVNKASLASQTDKDWEQIFLVDEVGRGTYWANQSFYRNRHLVHGNYVFILDDDDCLVYDDFVSDLKEIAAASNAAAILVKAFAAGRTLPTDLVWEVEKYPVVGNIGSGNFVVRLDYWQRHIRAFGQPTAGDYSFICDVFDDVKSNNDNIYWFDKVVMRAQEVSYGRPET